jgi:hypothetical protein
MIHNFTIFDNISEKMGSFLLRNLTVRELDTLKYAIDLNVITDKDILKIEDPKILTKKPYTGYDCIILLMCDNRVKNKTVYGLNFMIRDTQIYQGDNSIYSKKDKLPSRGDKLPSRRELLTDNNFITNHDYFAIFKSEDISKIRQNRQIKNGILINPNEEIYQDQSYINRRSFYNNTIAKANQDRYAKQVAGKSNYNEYFEKFISLFGSLEKKKTDAIKKHLEFYKENKTVKEYEFLKDFNFDNISKDFLQICEKAKFYINNKDRDGNITYDKFLYEIYKKFLDILKNATEGSLNNSENLEKLKIIKSILNKL